MVLLFFLLLVSPVWGQQVTAIWQDNSSNPCPVNPADNCQENNFVLERKMEPGGSYFVVGQPPQDTTSFIDSQVIVGNTYTWRIKAVNVQGESPYSNEATLLVQAATAGVSQIACLYTPTSPQPAGLVAAYSFNEGNGTSVADASGNGNSGTVIGATWQTGQYGNALDFSGTARVEIGNPSLNDIVPFTYCVWVNPRSQGGQNDGRILHKGTNSSRKQFQTDSSTLNSLGAFVDRANGAAQASSIANALTLNQWQYVCATYSETDGIRLYRNGTEVAYSSRMIGSGSTAADSGEVLRIGNRSTVDKGWDGGIDEVRIYNRILTTGEMITDMNTILP